MPLRMKLRTRSQSIRLRLTQDEVKKLSQHGQLAETVAFAPDPDGSLVYELVSSEVATAVGASFSRGKITVTVPAKILRAWSDGDDVGFEGEQAVPGGTPLAILVEKDWACLKPRANEDDANAYPHPEAGKATDC